VKMRFVLIGSNFCCSECAGRVLVSIGSPRRRIAERLRWASPLV
jgi:hypothetical protein